MSAAAAPTLSVEAARAQIAKSWDTDVLQTLKEYIAIPNQVGPRTELRADLA